MGLSEKSPGVLNWIEVRRVRRMGLECDVISFKEGEYKLCSVYASIVLIQRITAEGCSYVLEDRKEPTESVFEDGTEESRVGCGQGCLQSDE